MAGNIGLPPLFGFPWEREEPREAMVTHKANVVAYEKAREEANSAYDVFFEASRSLGPSRNENTKKARKALEVAQQLSEAAFAVAYPKDGPYDPADDQPKRRFSTGT